MAGERNQNYGLENQNDEYRVWQAKGIRIMDKRIRIMNIVYGRQKESEFWTRESEL